MIPKIIHSIWFQGWNQLPQKYYSNIKSIEDKNPDWKFLKWDEKTILEVIESYLPEYLEKFKSFKILHQKIDFARYCLLYIFGGVSVDVDCVALKSFDETPMLHYNTTKLIVSKNSTDSFINNAVIFSSIQNSLLKKFLNLIVTDCKMYQGDFFCIYYSTGPGALTNFINNITSLMAIDSLVILPNKYFEPCSGNDMDCIPGADAILDHQHEQSWVNPFFKKIMELYFNKTFRKELLVFVILVSIVILISLLLK